MWQGPRVRRGHVAGWRGLRRDGIPIRVASTRAVASAGLPGRSAPAAQPRAAPGRLFWPDTADGQARTNLRRELHQLRQLVPDEALDVDGTMRSAGATPPRARSTSAAFVTRSTQVRAALAALDATTARRRRSREQGRVAVDTLRRRSSSPGRMTTGCSSARDSLLRGCVELCDDLVDYLASKDPVAAIRAGPATHPARAVGGDGLPAADDAPGRRARPCRRPDDVPPLCRRARGAARRRPDGRRPRRC